VGVQNNTWPAHEEANGVEQVTIVLAIDTPDLREKLRCLIESDPHLQVIGESNNGLDALDMVGNLHPHVLLFSINSSDNREIIRLVNLRHPKTAVIVPHQKGHDKRSLDLLGSGVKTHILKNLDETQILEAIRSVNAGNDHMSIPSVKTGAPNHGRKIGEYVRDPIDILTPREREVFNLIVLSMTNAQIAARLSISRRTVEIHRARILRKLGLLNQHQQLLAYAAARGIKLDPLK
jgi:two-component system, NarL family, response regulator NreC